MILAPLLGTALVIAVATDPLNDLTAKTTPSAQERVAATEPLVRSATECIVRAVTADPRYAAKPTAPLGDLIVDSMPSCLTPVRAMIDAYDRYYGTGSGEAFFMGPYLDVLPKAVVAGAKAARQ
ncbi:MAG: hypothetical protein WBF03_16390 [Xanthobacteraceae bacterium]